jgi:hypothetical protein
MVSSFASRPFSAWPVISPLETKPLTMAINSSTFPVETECPVVPVAEVTAVPVPEGVSVVDTVTDPQAAMTMVNINMANILVIFFILLYSPIVYRFCEGMIRLKATTLTVAIGYNRYSLSTSVRWGDLFSANWGTFPRMLKTK